MSINERDYDYLYVDVLDYGSELQHRGKEEYKVSVEQQLELKDIAKAWSASMSANEVVSMNRIEMKFSLPQEACVGDIYTSLNGGTWIYESTKGWTEYTEQLPLYTQAPKQLYTRDLLPICSVDVGKKTDEEINASLKNLQKQWETRCTCEVCAELSKSDILEDDGVSVDFDTLIDKVQRFKKPATVACECGAEKCGHNVHSDWCQKHV